MTATFPPSSAHLPQSASAARTSSAPKLRIAYLTTEYPKVSHTFIRREILALESLGCEILRLSIRHPAGAIADESDRPEQSKTWYCLRHSAFAFLFALIIAKLRHPIRCVLAFLATLKMSRASDRGLIRHVAYFAEAALILQHLRAHKITHVHVHFGTNAAAVARLAHLMSKGELTYSLTVHGPDEFDSPRGFSLAQKVQDSLFTIAISDFCAAQLQRWVEPACWSKIHVIHCTVGESFFSAATPINPSSTTLLSIGRLNAQKGQLTLLRAAAKLKSLNIPFELILAGDGELRPIVDQYISELNLADRVRVTGWIDELEIRKLLLACRTLVQPSFAEGLPVVIMESLALARPVIASTVAAIPELVIPNQTGWLVPAGNIDLLVSAMSAALAASADQLNTFGNNGRKLVLERHNTAVEARKLFDLLTHHLSARGN
ncbi:MAG TPA: glycosyltransferase [Phycisphaerales bacterium]|nr:glycosyltransferase [Phycisphaerales bacterium]